MRINRLETIGGGLLAASLFAGAGCSNTSPQYESATSTSIPALVETQPLKLTPTPELQVLPRELTRLMAEPRMKAWRENLPEGANVSIVDYGPEYNKGKVIPSDGIKLRLLPDMNARTATLVKWLDYGIVVPFRYQIDKDQGAQSQEQWLILDEKYDEVVIWQCLSAGLPGDGRCFVPARVNGEQLISIDVKPPALVIPWGTSKQK